MIEGLRVLPWVWRERSRLRRNGDPGANTYLDCGHCMKTFRRDIRAEWGCGHLPEDERGEGVFPVEATFEPTVCPGFTIALPQVIEAAQAYSWWEKGQLRDRLGGYPHEVMIEAIDVLHAAVGEVSRKDMADAERGMRDGTP